MSCPPTLPNYNFTDPNFSRCDEDDKDTPMNPEQVLKDNWLDPMPPTWVLPLKDDYINECCALLQQEEIHKIRALMDEEIDVVQKTNFYIDQLTEKYSSYQIKLFLKDMRDIILLYNEVRGFHPI